MPFTPSTSLVSRIWTFADQYAPGETATRAGFDTAFDDVVNSFNKTLPLGIYPDHYATNTTPGTTDMTSAIQSALTANAGTGRPVRFRAGTAYAFSSKLTVPSGTGFVFEPGAYLYALASGFDNDDPTGPSRLQSNSLCVDFSGQTGSPFTANEDQFWYGGGITYETTEGRAVDGILARNCKNLQIDGVNFKGFPVSILLRIETLSGNWRINNVTAEDCTNSTDFGGSVTSGDVQITVVELDDSRVNSTPSTPGVITNIRGRNIQQKAAALTAYGQQADIVNLNGPADGGHGHMVGNISGFQTGEVLDIFLDSNLVWNIYGEEVQTVLKLIHGASYNVIRNVVGSKVRYMGIQIAGSVQTKNVAYNVIHGVSVRDIDWNNDAGAYPTSAIRIENSSTGGSYIAEHNVIDGVMIEPGAYGDHGIIAKDSSASNRIDNIRFNGAPAISQYLQNASRSNYFRETKTTVVRAYVGATQTIPSTTTLATVQFNSEATGGDYRGEFDTGTYKFTAEVPGWYNVAARVRFTASVTTAKLAIRAGGAEVASQQDANARQNMEVQTLVYLDDGDEVFVQCSQQSGGDRDLTTGEANSGLIITGPVL